jgi:hypothetical protein
VTGKRFKPGQKVEVSGDYMMVDRNGRSLKATRYQRSGNHFSPTLRSGFSFRLMNAWDKPRAEKKRRCDRCPKCGADLPRKFGGAGQ